MQKFNTLFNTACSYNTITSSIFLQHKKVVIHFKLPYTTLHTVVQARQIICVYLAVK